MMKLKCVRIVLVIVHFNLRQLVRKIVVMLEFNTDKSPWYKGKKSREDIQNFWYYSCRLYHKSSIYRKIRNYHFWACLKKSLKSFQSVYLTIFSSFNPFYSSYFEVNFWSYSHTLQIKWNINLIPSFSLPPHRLTYTHSVYNH